jgi:hypothetical protein
MAFPRLKTAAFALVGAVLAPASVFACDDRLAACSQAAPVETAAPASEALVIDQGVRRVSSRSYRYYRSSRSSRRAERRRHYVRLSRKVMASATGGPLVIASASSDVTGSIRNTVSADRIPMPRIPKRARAPETRVAAYDADGFNLTGGLLSEPNAVELASAGSLAATDLFANTPTAVRRPDTQNAVTRPAPVQTAAVAPPPAPAAQPAPLTPSVAIVSKPPEDDSSKMSVLRAMFLAFGGVLALASLARLALG